MPLLITFHQFAVHIIILIAFLSTVSNKTTSSFSCILGASVSVLFVIVLSIWIIQNETRHLALESRVMFVETALDDLQKKLALVSVTEESKRVK